MPAQRTKQLAFRLPTDLVGRIESCEKHICEAGLDVSRTDVVRLLLTFALNASACNLRVLIGADEHHGTGKDGKIDGKSLDRKLRRTDPVDEPDDDGT